MDTIIVTDTREVLAEKIADLNDEAKALRRKGFIGIRGSEYTDVHAEINNLVTKYEAAPPSAREQIAAALAQMDGTEITALSFTTGLTVAEIADIGGLA